ncbi:hypothetical protein F5148DRAFT_199703 [Russula earlei]|uniref:Uncharacterized protein n=1 Tax=Russula earlei TaxID=71964 RepID=A0ACC0U4Q8_9AGAM|nr:hypothetical protein F5148DRAFT_199703 [Russula earlei]
MQANPHFELYRVPRSQANEVHLNGRGNQYPPLYQNEAMENVYYWYDGNVPYYTDATAWQPVDDYYLHMNFPGYPYVEKFQGVVAHQLVNMHQPHVDFQESLHPYALQLREPPLFDAHDRAPPMFSTPNSPCTSLSWSDSQPSPTQRQQDLGNVVGELPSASSSPTSSAAIQVAYLPSVSVPQTVPSVGSAERLPLEAPGPRRPSTAFHTTSAAPELDSTPRDVVGRRAPKQRRVTRAVQPLACFFCRGRKIACGPPANCGSGDRTCEPCARRRLVCEYPAESYRGRRSSGPKVATVKPQRR